MLVVFAPRRRSHRRAPPQNSQTTHDGREPDVSSRGFGTRISVVPAISLQLARTIGREIAIIGQEHPEAVSPVCVRFTSRPVTLCKANRSEPATPRDETRALRDTAPALSSLTSHAAHPSLTLFTYRQALDCRTSTEVVGLPPATCTRCARLRKNLTLHAYALTSSGRQTRAFAGSRHRSTRLPDARARTRRLMDAFGQSFRG